MQAEYAATISDLLLGIAYFVVRARDNQRLVFDYLVLFPVIF